MASVVAPGRPHRGHFGWKPPSKEVGCGGSVQVCTSRRLVTAGDSSTSRRLALRSPLAVLFCNFTVTSFFLFHSYPFRILLYRDAHVHTLLLYLHHKLLTQVRALHL